MGKKSLLAPTSKEDTGIEKNSENEKKPLKAAGTAKKAAPKTAKKKAAKTTAAKKRAAGGKTAKKKAAPVQSPKKKKAPSKKATTSKPDTPKKAERTVAGKKKTAAPKKAAAKKKVTAVSIKALLKRKFDVPVSGKKYSPPSGRKRDAEVSSPPFFVGETAEETDRVRRLLFKRFDSVSGDARDRAVEGTEPSVRETAKLEDGTTVQTVGQTDGETASGLFSTSGGEGLFPEEKKTMDPMQKMAVLGLGVLVVLMIMVMWASALNVGKFYVKQVDGQLEIWKGRFSPKGADKIFTLSSASMPAEPKEIYSKEEAYTFIFEGIITDADALLGTDEMPDFEHIRSTLASARPFAITKEMSGRLQRRLDKIDMMALVYKADVLAGKGTMESLTRARESLEKAMGLNLDDVEHGLIEQKINWVDQKLGEAAE